MSVNSTKSETFEAPRMQIVLDKIESVRMASLRSGELHGGTWLNVANVAERLKQQLVLFV